MDHELEIKFKDLLDELKHHREQRDELLDYAHSLRRHMGRMERVFTAHFKLDLSDFGDEEGTQDGDDGPATVSVDALAWSLYKEYHGDAAAPTLWHFQTSENYGQWHRLAGYVQSLLTT